MIDFNRAQLTNFIIHNVGNKGLGEELVLRDKEFTFKDDFVKDTLWRYLTKGFVNDIYYKFRRKSEFAHRDVQQICKDIFQSRSTFVANSKLLADLLYDQTIHPKLKGGEFYVCYFKDMVVDAELCDCIGIFKTETKESFLKVFQDSDDIEVDNGININKLDKGCLIFNTETEKGYKLSIIDNNNKVRECAVYWKQDFLAAQLKENSYYHTDNFIETCKGFAEEVLIEDNNVSKQEQMMLLNKSLNFVADNAVLDLKEFENKVLEQKELIDSFKNYRKEFFERLDLVTTPETFDISQTAVKENKKHLRTVIKLDKNFHIYIHANHQFLEKGFDEEKGMKFYKLWYVNEE